MYITNRRSGPLQEETMGIMREKSGLACLLLFGLAYKESAGMRN
jgi:hypothetical protein